MCYSIINYFVYVLSYLSFSYLSKFDLFDRLHTIVEFDRILVLGQGEIIEYDTPEKLLSKKDSEFSRMLNDYHSLHSHSSLHT